MFIKYFYDTNLRQLSYYLESNNEACVIDPSRNVKAYLELANERKATIKFIFETHLHTDFVSGHCELSKLTNAVIVFGPYAKTSYHSFIASHNEMFVLGSIMLKVLHTPGHTIESTSYLVIDSNQKERYLFSGDTLIFFNVGRPDFMSGIIEKESLIQKLYQSVNFLLDNLPDNVIIYPTHVERSSDVTNFSFEANSSIEQYKKYINAFNQLSFEEFKRQLISNLENYPSYYFRVSQLNRKLIPTLHELLIKTYKPLTTQEFTTLINNGALVIDTREVQEFTTQHLTGAINIPFTYDFLFWIGHLITYNKQLLIIGNSNNEADIIIELAKIGYENILGFLQGGIESWMYSSPHKLTTIKSTTFYEARKIFYPEKFILIDVREYAEAAKEKIYGAINVPLTQIPEIFEHLDPQANYIFYCQSGIRSVIACSILLNKGFKQVINVYGGINLVKIDTPELIEYTSM